MSFPSYPEYKDSGVEWLGEVPAHWAVVPLKRLGHMQSGGFISPAEIEDAGKYPVIGGNGPRGFTSSYTHEGLFPVIGRQGALCGNINYAKGSFWASEHAVVVSPGNEVDPVWLGELLRSMNLNQYSVSAAQPGLAVERVRNLGAPYPPSLEQSTIARFLDHETARIDALIEEQQRLIELLKEKRQAVISHAVTKGLDSDVPMKDSGVEWLGEVPAHWDVTAFRRVLVRIEQGWSPECFNEPAPSGSWGVLKAGAVNNGIYRESENKALSEGLQPRPELEVQAGDVIMCRASGSPDLIGSVAHVSDSRAHLMLSDKLFRLVLNGGSVTGIFLSYLMGSEPLRRQIEMSINGAEGLANNLSQSAIKSLEITLPPTGEQERIVRWLDKQMAVLEELVGSAEEGIELLTERRAALISAAVTGKIDVRGWQPPVSDTESPHQTTSELPA